MDISTELFEIIRTDPLQYYPYIPQLFKKADMASQVITFCETVLPLNRMADGMGDYVFADKLTHEFHCLDLVLQELKAYPRQGVKLIKTGLNSRAVRCRNMACYALAGWVKLLAMPLSDISPELYAEIERIHKIEVKKQTKKMMRELLDGRGANE